MITWDDPSERYFQHGIDHGVLYPSDGPAVAWNGITGVEEGGNGSSTTYYIDGKAYFNDVTPSDFSGKLTAFFFPDAFSKCIGMPEVAEGLIADNQRPRRFSLSYRSLIGSGLEGDRFGYQIHMIHNCNAVIGTRSRKSLSETPSPIEFTFDLTATPVKLAGFRPTAHYVIDTRRLDSDTITELEGILYGNGVTAARMPTPTELFDLLSFGAGVEVTEYLATGLINYKGSKANIVMTGDDTYQINNVNAVDNGDGTYTISDGGDTTVIEV